MKNIIFLILILICFFVAGVEAQTVITGVVQDDENNPLIGVSVFVEDQPTKGALSDLDGKYSIEVDDSNAILIFSSVGFTDKKVNIGGKKEINVTMITSYVKLDGVTISASGSETKKRSTGYATTTLGSDDLNLESGNVMSGVQGKIAGVEISAAQAPGSSTSVIIRGASSLGSNQPLYVVDGVTLTNVQTTGGGSLNFSTDFGTGTNAIDQDNIATITVLKGAGATALYGSRATNGVVLITTKSGKSSDGRMKLSYSGSVGFLRVGRLPNEQSRFGQGWSAKRALDENGNWGPRYDGKDRVWGRVLDISTDPNVELPAQLIKPYVYLPDRIKDFFQTGITYKNYISLSGGNANTTYFFSASQSSTDGSAPTDNDSYRKYAFSTKGKHNYKKWTISTGINLSHENTKAIPGGQGSSAIRSLYEIPGEYSLVDMQDRNNKFYSKEGYFTQYGINPYLAIDTFSGEFARLKLFGNVALKYNILDNLFVRYKLGFDYESITAKAKRNKNTYPSDNVNVTSATNGFFSQTIVDRVQFDHNLIANYDFEVAKDFSLNSIIGINVNERTFTSQSSTIRTLDVPGLFNFNNSLSNPTATNGTTDRRLVGMYANLDFSFRNYLFLTLTGRNDISSTLPLKNNSYFYSGVTVSFVLSDFLKERQINLKAVNFAKIRLSYGQTGADTGPYRIYRSYVATNIANPGFPKVTNLSFPLNGVNAWEKSSILQNPDLKPESTSEFEVGTELSFLKERISVDFSYYNKLTEDLLGNLNIDSSTGFSVQRANIADVRNQGVELLLTLVPIKIGDFSWELSTNYSKNVNNVVKSLNGETFIAGFGTGGIYAVEGKAIGQFKYPSVKKVTFEGKESTVVDRSTGLPVPTTTPVYVNKDINEDYRLGITNGFSYKGIRLSVTLDLRMGGYIFSNIKNYSHWVGIGPHTVINDREPFIIPNSVVENVDGTYSESSVPIDPTALHTFYNNGGIRGEEDFIIDRSYFKLRNVSISYNVPKKYLNFLTMKTASVSFTASNILLWTPVSNQYIDPEVTTFGTDIGSKFGEFGTMPPNQIYTFAIRFTL